MTIMRKMIKPALLALAISMTLGSTIASAAERNTSGTLSIHGFQPLLPLVGAKGELKPGATITISDEYYRYFDRDNGTTDKEVDISKTTGKAIIQWYIRDKSEESAPLPPPDDAWGTGISYVIPFVDGEGKDIDYANGQKILSFRIVPLTENGLPDIGKAIEVNNSIKLSGSEIPNTIPPTELPVNPDNPYEPGTPIEPEDKTPEITGPGGNVPPTGPTDPTDPPDESGIIYPAGDGFKVRIAYAKLDANGEVVINTTTGLPELDLTKIVYDELADESKIVTIDQTDAYGNKLLGPDGITELPQITVSLKTPTIPTVRAAYAVAIYEAKRDDAGDIVRDEATNEIVVKTDENGPINMAGAFKNSIKWTIGASGIAGEPTLVTPATVEALEPFEGELVFNTQANNDVAKAVSSVASEQGLVIGVSFNDNLAAAVNKGTAPTPPPTE